MGGPLAFPATAIRSVPSGRIVGRSTTGTGRAELLTAAQLRELCSLYSVSQIDSALAGKVDTSSALDQAFTETITWTGTTAPSGTATARYSWVRVGKLVWFNFRMSWTSAGSLLSAAQWDMPADMPAPAVETGQDAGEILCNMWGASSAGQGAIGSSGTGAESRMQLSATSSTQFRVRWGTASVGFLSAGGVYRCV